MEIYQIAPTKLTPGVIFNLESNTMSMKGNSIPENSNSFYLPFLEWIDERSNIIKHSKHDLQIEVDLEYFNSASLKQIIKLFLKCTELVGQHNVKVVWYCDSSTDDFMETGMDIANALSIPFTYVFRKQ